MRPNAIPASAAPMVIMIPVRYSGWTAASASTAAIARPNPAVDGAHLRPRLRLPERDAERAHQRVGGGQAVNAHTKKEHTDYGDDRDAHGSLLFDLT